MNRDIVTEEKLWQEPDWKCPHCHFTNLAIRSSCRNCGYVGGEISIHEVAALEVTS